MITENVKLVKERIAEAAIKSGRNPGDITLVAATKTQNAAAVRAAILAGADACGENRVQELVEKNREDAYSGAPLHFIGHLQKNKVKQVVGVAELIQSVDSMELAALIGRRAVELGIVQDILLEVNIGGELSKSGFDVEMVDEAMEEISKIKGLELCGLMTIPPITGTQHKKFAIFNKLLKIYLDKCVKIVHNKKKLYLSMGMSGDFEDAILCGSNMVRVGTAIFGARN
ncbi:MAG: YggS family pyridoxal phosphate-dependent enzyme [Oscillospiraceae bacterium]|jgi:pyridoxal phosphate enzyme (YggS family)|nr:YggS family pyridoxal phosphate-dependent enzyme [Oscillospiraceae bacterium]